MPAHQEGSGRSGRVGRVRRVGRVGRANRAFGIVCLVAALALETTIALIWGIAPGAGWSALLVVWIPPAVMVALFAVGRPIVSRLASRRADADEVRASSQELRQRPLYPIVMVGPDLSVTMARRPAEIADRATLAASGLSLERALVAELGAAGELGALGEPDGLGEPGALGGGDNNPTDLGVDGDDMPALRSEQPTFEGLAADDDWVKWAQETGLGLGSGSSAGTADGAGVAQAADDGLGSGSSAVGAAGVTGTSGATGGGLGSPSAAGGAWPDARGADLRHVRAYDARLRPVLVSRCGSGAIATLVSQQSNEAGFENTVSEILLAYRRMDQPVRELRNFIEYLAYSQRNGVIGQLHL